ncbi:MAG TPA: radical SAM protein [Candidatus Hydrogenedentes bacterium]|nr:radical SAM protein [Candidatus Hydrogenedentota bacterium]HRT20202.1 radical SAM protein [Candidatus Hydrogenedentota bacterium]HRT64264.1 radical SAM protein [Candidatus Hydrogenedentota bacterium]
MRILFLSAELNRMPRLGISSLAACLSADGHEVRHAVAARLGKKRLRDLMRTFKPDIVGYSIMTYDYASHVALNRELKKEFRFRAVFGGIHPTFLPEMIDDDPECDAICIGEGEWALAEFCRRIQEGGAYWQTPNFWVRHDGVIHRNPLRPLATSLDAFPVPDHRVLYEGDPYLARLGWKIFMASRGCPHACSYCFNAQWNRIYRGCRPVVRHRAPHAVIDEICAVKERYPLRAVGFCDDDFALKPEGWMEAFCAEYRDRVGLPFGCTCRPEHVTDELIGLLKATGLCAMWIAVECADERVANEVLRRNLKNEQILRATEVAKKHGIRLFLFNLVGIPVENSFETDLKTLDFNVAVRPTYSLATLLYPWPGTNIYDYAVEHGFLSPGERLSPSVRRFSVFSFRSPAEKRKIENLHKLFDFFVRFPWLRKHCESICSLPLSWIYLAVYLVWQAYVMAVKQWPPRASLPVRSIREHLTNARLMLRLFRTP